ncbi:MAG: hypothetical protein KGJ35_00710 [Patescibacteria group bacterium]|nr:hypothetical protein [Patescibacteria group bacterium]
MNLKLLSQPAFDTIDQYLHFKIGAAECAVPYYNNRHLKQRAALRATIGKGSPREIFDETEILGLRQGIKPNMWNDKILKEFMCDHNIGIDCSGFAYYVLATENKVRGFGSLDKHLHFNGRGILGALRAKLRPIENADVTVFASDKNSIALPWQKTAPGDFITMTGAEIERNHILVVDRVEYQNFVPIVIHYVNAIAWPEDGQYGHGIRPGKIEILNPKKTLLEQKWIEKEKTGDENPTYLRAKISTTEVRRLSWWQQP